MVMATYSPQHVGLEFVRQYYTVLHKDPQQLHRFYTKNSLFSHGGSQANRTHEPVIGQEAIHMKICQLKFRDCYAKIISVDSHPTIGDGVVVQVTGELSNDGLPMRRFMQTFVLAQQAPKKYCVYNDIFRYQDDDLEDDADGNEDSPESDNEVSQPEDQLTAPISEMQLDDEVPATNPSEAFDVSNRNFNDSEVNKGLVNGDLSGSEDQQEELPDPGMVDASDVNVKSSFEPPEQQIPSEQTLADEFQSNDVPSGLSLTELEDHKSDDYQVEEAKAEDLTSPGVEETIVADEPSKPVTFAAIARKNAQGGTSQPAPVSRPAPKPQQQPPATSPAALPQRTPPRKREDSKSEKNESRRKFNAPPPDDNQIFIGNLPAGIKEADVRGIFKEFGNVVEVRINPKNFGFVAFDSPEPVLEILNRPSSKPITFNTKIINIEEKRSSPSGGPRGGPKKDKEGMGRPRNDGYGRGGGKGGQSGNRGGKGGGQGGGGAGYQRQKSGGEGNKGGPGGAGEGNRGGRFRDRPGGGRGGK